MREPIELRRTRQFAPEKLAPKSRSRLKRLKRDDAAFELVKHVASRRGVKMLDLVQASRGSDAAAQARQLAMYLIHVLLGRPQDVVGVLFGRQRTSVCHTCKAVELRRDDPALEAEIAGIEAILSRTEQGSLRHVA